MNDDSASRYQYSSAQTVTHNNAVSAWYTFKYTQQGNAELIYEAYAVERGIIYKFFGRSLKMFKDVAFKTMHLSIPILKKLSVSVTVTFIYPKKTPTPKSEQPK